MLLRIRKLSKTYTNGVEALKQITLTIPRGMYGLLGPALVQTAETSA
jgi:ABC-2 type transport system ATP-binding protein